MDEDYTSSFDLSPNFAGILNNAVSAYAGIEKAKIVGQTASNPNTTYLLLGGVAIVGILLVVLLR